MENEVTTMTVELVPPMSATPIPVVSQIAPVETPREFSGKRGDFAKDMAFLQAELSPQTPALAPVHEPVQPVITPAVAPAIVPEKFKAPDGGLDVLKVEKSTADAEAALAKYAEKEKQLRQKMYEVSRMAQYQGQTVQPSVGPVISGAPPTQFEVQVANDLINAAASFGEKMTEGYALAQARVQIKMAEAQHKAEQNLTETIRARMEDDDRRKELEYIAKYDDSVLSPEGFEALSKIREEKPWINQSLTPWTEAHKYYLADKVMKERQAGQVQPTPQGLTAKAPPTPVGPAPRVVVQETGPDLSSPQAIDAHIKSFNGDQSKEAAFWRSRGLRF